jgi:hypothetical protein
VKVALNTMTVTPKLLFYPASSTTKTGRHDIAEIFLKVALNTINQNQNHILLLNFMTLTPIYMALNYMILGTLTSKQSVSIITKIVSSNPAHGEVYLILHYVIKFVNDLRWVRYIIIEFVLVLNIAEIMFVGS